ncbi:hypothetical protein [Kitasatospora sp. NPDC056181]|uniref:hypothetical protein n=1 Tax=Kitasatospora sp. NPDC056181 TaxID=3345737 RepID=UPI0035DB4669
MFISGPVEVPWPIGVVVCTAVVAAVACLVLAAVFSFMDKAENEARKAAREAVPTTKHRAPAAGEAARNQAATVDYAALAKLAEALEKLNRAGRFLIASISFAAVASLAASAGSIAGAVQ